MGHVTRPRPRHAYFVTQGLGIATINLPSKFEVSISTHYEDIKSDTICEKWSGLGQSGVTQGHWN